MDKAEYRRHSFEGWNAIDGDDAAMRREEPGDGVRFVHGVVSFFALLFARKAITDSRCSVLV